MRILASVPTECESSSEMIDIQPTQTQSIG